jgi:sugar phosphate isomerase/epimerase
MKRAYSLSFLTCLDAPPPIAIKAAADAGYDHVGLRLLPASPGGIAFSVMDDAALRRRTQDALADTDVSIFDVEIVRIGPDFSVETYKPFLEACALLGARAILVAGDDHNEHRLTAAFASFCQAAHGYGLSADLEFMPQSEVRDAAAALRILTAAAQPNAAIIVDALHVSRSRTPFADVAAIPRQWMNYAQICDGPAEIPADLDGLNFAARHERLLPGDGAIDLVGLFASLPAEIPISVEVPNDRQAPPLGLTEWAKRGLAASKALLAAADERRDAGPL